MPESHQSKKKIMYILRWIAVIPAAVAAYFISNALYGVLFYLYELISFSDGDDLMFTVIMPMIRAGLTGFIFVYSGDIVAPSHQKIACLILLVLLILFCGIGVSGAVRMGHTISILEAIASVIGAVIAYTSVPKTETKKEI